MLRFNVPLYFSVKRVWGKINIFAGHMNNFNIEIVPKWSGAILQNIEPIQELFLHSYRNTKRSNDMVALYYWELFLIARITVFTKQCVGTARKHKA